MRSELTHKQSAFVREYMVSGNAADAARKAGYSARTANAKGHTLITHDKKVKAKLQVLRKRMETRKILSAQEVLERLSIEAQDEENNGAVRVRALETLAKHHGLLVERREIGLPGAFSKLTDDEIDSEILALAERRGSVAH